MKIRKTALLGSVALAAGMALAQADSQLARSAFARTNVNIDRKSS